MKKLKLSPSIKKMLSLIAKTIGLSLRIMVRTAVGLSFFLLIGLGILLFTSAGTSLIWHEVQSNVPGLSGKVVNGHLGRGFVLENLKLEIPDAIHLEVEYLDVSYNILGLLSGELVIDNLETRGVLVVIGDKPENLPPIVDFLLKRLNCVSAYTVDDKTKDIIKFREVVEDDTVAIRPKLASSSVELPVTVQEPTKQEENKPNISNNVIGFDKFLSLPIKVSLKRVVAHDFLMLSEVIDVAVSELMLKAELVGDTLYVKPSEASLIDVLLHNERFSPSAPSPRKELLKEPFDSQEIEQRVAKLPMVFLPIKIEVEEFNFNNARYHQDGYDTGVGIISLAGSYRGSLVTIKKLTVAHELGQAALTDSSMDLRDYYPIEANLTGFSHNTEWFDLLNNHTLSAHAKGNLTDLSVSADIKGLMQAEVKGRIGVLSPSLPFKLELLAKNLGWPVASADYKAKQLELKAHGSLEKIYAEVRGEDLKALAYPEVDLETKLATTFSHAELEYFNANTKLDELKLKGNVDWENGIAFKGSLEGAVGDISQYLPNERGNLQLAISTDMHYENLDNWGAIVSQLKGSGSFRGYPLELKADGIDLNSLGKCHIKNLHLASGQANTIDINGTMNGELKATGNINMHDISIIDPLAIGQLYGTVSLSGTKQNPVLSLALNTPLLGYKDSAIYDVKLDTRLATRNWHVVEAAIYAELGQVRSNQEGLAKNLKLTLEGSELSHELTLQGFIHNDRFATSLHGEANSTRTAYQGILKTLNYDLKNLPIVLTKPLSFKVDKNLTASISSNQWSVAHNTIDVSEGFYTPKNASVRISAVGFDLMRLKPFLPVGLKFTAPVGLVADLAINNRNLEAKVRVKSSDGSVIYQKNTQIYRNVLLEADFTPQEAEARVNLDLGKDGSLITNVRVANPLAEERGLSGHLAINNIDMAILSKFVSDLSASSGVLHGSGNYGGTLAKPTFNGTIEIENMNVNPVMDIGRIENINTILNIRGSSADVFASFLLGEKRGALNGQISWENAFNARLHLNTEELPFNFIGYGTGLVKLKVDANFSPEVNSVLGSVDIPVADIKVKNLPESSVSASSDVVEINRTRDGLYKVKSGQQSPVELDFRLNIGPKVKINAMGLRTYLHGSLHLAQKPKKQMTVEGRINLIDGKFHAYGQNLIIENGRISFVGDVNNPSLDIRAIRDPHSMEDESITAGVLVTGSASNPKINIFSKPKMSQSEALSYLLRGKGMDESSANSSDMSTQLLLGVGLMQTSGFISDIGEVLGFEDVALDSKGDGDETSVEVSAYILPKVQVAYGYGIYNSMSEFRLRYEMFPRFYIEGVSSLEQAVDAIYKFEFDF